MVAMFKSLMAGTKTNVETVMTSNGMMSVPNFGFCVATGPIRFFFSENYYKKSLWTSGLAH
jgi:hypothetical protein